MSTVQSTRAASSNAPTVNDQRFHGGGGRPVFGLWASYLIAASHLFSDSALALAVQCFVPITAAGQRRSYTSFPFNRLSCESLTCTRPFYIEMGFRSGYPTLPFRIKYLFSYFYKYNPAQSLGNRQLRY